MKMSAFNFNSHPSEAGWHKHPDTAWDLKEKQCDVLHIGEGITKGIEGCCEVLLLGGIRGKKYGTSHVDNRVIKARMGYIAQQTDFLLAVFRFLRGSCIRGAIFLGIGRKLAGQKRSS